MSEFIANISPDSAFPIDISNAIVIDFPEIPIIKEDVVFPGMFWGNIDSQLFEFADNNTTDYKIIAPDGFSFEPAEEHKTDKNVYPKAKSWRYVGHLKNSVVFISRKLRKDDVKITTNILIRDKKGIILNDFIAQFIVHRFSFSELTDNFIICTSDNELILYSEGQYICVSKTPIRVKDNQNIRSIAISPKGDFVLLTYEDRVYFMDMKFTLTSSWVTPIKEGWVKGGNTVSKRDLDDEYLRCMRLLELDGEPGKDDIRKAFRRMLMAHHPDKNPYDPLAEDKTRGIISAYEKLTNEDALEAFEGNVNAEYWYNIKNSLKINIPNTPRSITIIIGIGGTGEDWIYTSYIGKHSGNIYLSCASGNVYCVSKDGVVLRRYKTDMIVDTIFEINELLYFETYNHLIILKNDNIFKYIHRRGRGRLIWHEKGFVFVRKKEIDIFSLAGEIVGNIIMRIPIYDVYFSETSIKVVTSKKTFSFHVSHFDKLTINK